MPTLESLWFIKITLCIAGLSYCVQFVSCHADGTQTCGQTSGGVPVNNCTPLTAPRNVTVTNKTATALLINWTHVDHSELLGYRVRYSRNITCDSAGNYTNCSFSIFLCKNITTIWLEDLEIYTEYWIEVVAFKNGTFSENISTSVARTDEGVPSRPPKIVNAANDSSTSISVTWESIPKEHRRGVIIKYTVTITEADTGNVTTAEADGWNNSIKIDGLKKYTLYNVTVSASTSKGTSIESNASQIRTDEDAPDGAPILNPDATEVTQHSFVVSWDKDIQSLNGILRKYKIRWKKVNSADYHNETLIIPHHSRRRRDITIPSNRTFFELKNLSLYTNYSVEVAAVTIKEGNYGSPKYFMTGEGVPTSPPLNVTAYNTSSTSIFVTWSPPPSDNIPGILLGYEVSYTPSEPEISHNSSTIRRVMLCSCNTSIELTNLTVYELYNITVAAFTSAGIGNESEIIQIWTDEEEPKEAPQNVSAVSETFDSINVTWREVPEEKRDGIIILYEVNITGGSFSKSNKTSDLTIEIQGLEMFKMYSVTVRAFTSIGPGPFSYSTKLKTKEEAPPSVPNVNGHAFNRTAINVTWDIALPKGFKLRGFNVTYGWQNVTYRWQNVTYRWQNETVRVNEPERTVVLTGLEVSTEYEIKVAAATNYQGNYSQAILVKTDDGAPSGSPTNVVAVAKSTSSINVTWGPVPEFQRKGNVSMYEIHVTNSSEIHVMNSSHYGVANIFVCANNFSVVVDELEMFVTYYVRVRALTAVGFGPWSRNVTVTTNQKAPEVVLNATASAKNKTSILVSWQIERIHPRLKPPDTYQVSYCPHCLEKTCRETNISTSSGNQTTLVSGLLVGVTYNITVRAINITASDGTPVETPYGKYSKPVYNTTHEGAPKVPPNVTAGPLTTTSINVSWSQIPCDRRGGEIIKYFIEIHNISGRILEKQVSGNDFSYEVTGLEVYSNYSARVLAATEAGNSSFSDFYNTTTHQPAPEKVPTDVKVKETGKTSITVTWKEILYDEFVQGYTVKYKKKGAASSNFTKVDRVKEMVLDDLNKFTEYTIQVAARSSQPGNYSEAISAKTLEDVPGAAPPGVYVDVLDSTSVRINWREVPKEERHGIIKGYRVLYKRKQNGKRRRRSTDNVKTVTTVDGAYSILLKSLDKAAEYEVKVRAFTSVGDGPSLPNISFTTSEDIPSKPPVNIKAVDRLSPDTIRVSWEPVPERHRHGTLQNYKVMYQKVEVGDIGIEEEPVEVKIVNASETDVELEGLEPYVRYRITVAASTTKGYGPPSASVSGETCHCKQKFSTSWRRYEPYANVTEDNKPGQIIPIVLQSMVDECCGNCSAYERIRLDFKENGKNGTALRNSSRELLESLDEATDFTFPVYGFNEQDRYKGGYGYIPVIESAGVAFIVYPKKSSNQNTMYDLMISCLPVLVLPIITACVSGMIIWGLERINNSKDFPAPFLQGTWEGIWWAFVSMTTLGYGDRAPLSGKGRFFAIVWILFGLVIIALTMAMLTTALTAVAVKEEYKLYGTKIAAEFNSPEYNLGTRRNAKFDKDKHYNNIDEVAQALINKEVDGILVDTYSAGLRGDLFNRPELLVSKIIDYKSAYGVVFSSSTNRLRKCFQRYMVSHKAEIFEMVKKKVKPIETGNSTTSSEEQAGGILDNNSPQFRKGLKYAIVCFGIALLLSLTYEVIRRVRKRHKVHQQVQFKTKLQAEMSHLVEEFMQRTKKIKQRLGEKHRQEILKFWKLQRKGSTTNNWLRISQVSPHPSEVIITDYNC